MSRATVKTLFFRRHSLLSSNIQHTCDLIGDAKEVYAERVSRDTVVVVSEYDVKISEGDSLAGQTGQCDVVSACLSYHYSFSQVVCDTYELPSSPTVCWTTETDDTPVCVEPGSNWVGAMVGAVLTGFFAFSFIMCALCITRSFKRFDPDDEVQVIVVPVVSPP